MSFLFLLSFWLTIFVDARGLDSTNSDRMIQTLAKHPDVGHAWLMLEGDGFAFSGGHSGEISRCQPRYVEGVAALLEAGDPNPARYLWCERKDGFYEEGGGYHRPTYAVKFPITCQGYDAICAFIAGYDFSRYSLTGSQCCTFVVEAARLGGINLCCLETMKLSSVLWSDPKYASITFGSPDHLQRSLKRSVKEGRGVPLPLHAFRCRHK